MPVGKKPVWIEMLASAVTFPASRRASHREQLLLNLAVRGARDEQAMSTLVDLDSIGMAQLRGWRTEVGRRSIGRDAQDSRGRVVDHVERPVRGEHEIRELGADRTRRNASGRRALRIDREQVAVLGAGDELFAERIELKRVEPLLGHALEPQDRNAVVTLTSNETVPSGARW